MDKKKFSNIDKKSVGNRLKEFAKEKLGSVNNLAEALEMKPSALSSGYISGKSLPGSEIISKLILLGCDINWLLHGENNIVKEQTPEYNHNATDHSAVADRKGIVINKPNNPEYLLKLLDTQIELINILKNSNKNLEEENKKLRDEIQKLRG